MATRDRHIGAGLYNFQSVIDVADDFDPDVVTLAPVPTTKRRIGTERSTAPKIFETWEYLHAGHDDYPGSNQYLWFQLDMPNDLFTNLECVIKWIANTTSGDVRWGCRTVDLESSGVPDDLYNIEAGFADVGVTTTVSAVEAYRPNTSTLTIGGAIAANRTGVFGVYRDTENVLDTMTEVASAFSVRFRYDTA